MKLLFKKSDNSSSVFLKNDKTILKKFYQKQIKSQKKVEHIFNEKIILYYIKENNIKNCNKIISTKKDSEGPELNLELVNGCPLNVLLKKNFKLNSKFVKLIIYQLIEIIETLHNHKILYRDIKASNLLINENGVLELIDFGLSKILTKENNFLTNSICGTPHSIAPEILNQKEYSFNSDFYSIGILMYELIIGEPPFGYKKTFETIKNDHKKDIDLSFFNENEKQLLEILLNKDPIKRDLNNIKNSNYFKEIKFISISEINENKYNKNIFEKFGLCYYYKFINNYIKVNYNFEEEDKIENNTEDIFEDF